MCETLIMSSSGSQFTGEDEIHLQNSNLSARQNTKNPQLLIYIYINCILSKINDFLRYNNQEGTIEAS